ncbi:GFA family protein [Pseudomonas sp. NPDC090201]|jgi:hypothetical protein|uniref:GFA family protein n=1 Tax=Pseudomonas sp. NPDC090201 TaxID=3364475 RepID=UPI00381D0400
MNADQNEFDGRCHCGTVRFHARLSDGLNSARRCDCSLCRMRGAVVVSARLQDLQITAGAEALTLYQFHTKTAKHYFCSKCGIYTHHQRRSNPEQFGINAACLEGVSPFDFAEVVVCDGVQHPSDEQTSEKRSETVGVLRFVPDDGSSYQEHR